MIVGFKSAHFAGPGWESVEAAVKAGKEADLPVMVDFGYLNQIRNLPTLLLDKLRPGDIYTHCYSGHREELLTDGKVNPAMFTGGNAALFSTWGLAPAASTGTWPCPPSSRDFRPTPSRPICTAAA